MVDKSNWRTSDINVDSLWIINERDRSGKHANVYHGNFVPQIPYQLISRYTNDQEVVLELFSGSGTTLFECEKLNRKYMGYDINQNILDYVKSKMVGSQALYTLENCDVADSIAFDNTVRDNLHTLNANNVDFIIAHPPYLDIVKFTDQTNDLSNISETNVFLEKLKVAIGNGLRYLNRYRYFAVVMGDIYKSGQVVPLGFMVMNMILQNFRVKMKGIIVKNIEGNRGKLGQQNIWKYRALMSDYYLFKHEYIYVFKKEF